MSGFLWLVIEGAWG